MKRLMLSIWLFCIALGAHAQPSVLPYCVTGFTQTGAPITAPCTAANPLPVIIPGGGGGSSGTTAALYTYNAVVAVTGTAVQITASTQALSHGLSCFVVAAGTNKLSIGASNAVTNPQSVSFSGGSAVGTYESSGQGWSAAIATPNLVYINGTAGDGVTCWGN